MVGVVLKKQVLLFAQLFGAVRAAFHPANDPMIRVVGRTVANGTSLFFDWPSTYVEMVADGPLALILHERWGHGNEYFIMINSSTRGSVRSFQLNTTNASAGPTHFDILPPGETASVRVEKVTEARTDAGGLVRFLGVDVAALHPLTRPRTRRVECIGDSIMCAAHSERYFPFQTDCPSTRGTPEARESSRLSWCTVVARHFDADYQMQCESGNGLIMTDGDTCHAVGGSGTCMPEKCRHNLDCLSDGSDDRGCTTRGCGSTPGCMVAADTPVTPFDPHAVIINLGQNDYGAPAHIDPLTHKPVKSHLPTTSQWVRFYAEFVQNITDSNAVPPHFFLACGGMASKYCNDTQAAVAHMNSLGKANVHYLDITASSVARNASYMGCANHPSWISHEAAAEVAIPIIEAALDWSEAEHTDKSKQSETLRFV